MRLENSDKNKEKGDCMRLESNERVVPRDDEYMLQRVVIKTTRDITSSRWELSSNT